MSIKKRTHYQLLVALARYPTTPVVVPNNFMAGWIFKTGRARIVSRCVEHVSTRRHGRSVSWPYKLQISPPELSRGLSGISAIPTVMWKRLSYGRSIIPYRLVQRRGNSEVVVAKPKAKLNYLTVALVGQPNVGKSTIFNYFCKKNKSIVTPFAGTTRDRKEAIGGIAGLDFRIIDTGGFDDRGQHATQIKQQVKHAIMEAHVVLFVIDGKTGITTVDEDCAKWLRIVLGSLPNTSAPPRDVILVGLLPHRTYTH